MGNPTGGFKKSANMEQTYVCFHIRMFRTPLKQAQEVTPCYVYNIPNKFRQPNFSSFRFEAIRQKDTDIGLHLFAYRYRPITMHGINANLHNHIKMTA